MITYRIIFPEEIDQKLFSAFIRHQEVNRCWRKIEGTWQLRDIAFTDDWSKADYTAGIETLKKTLLAGGFLIGAFSEGKLKGFASVEPGFFGSRRQYLDLSNLHVSEDMRRKGIGRTLFYKAADWAKSKGPKSSTSQHIRQQRLRSFTMPWAAWRPKNTTRRWWKKSPATVRWNTASDPVRGKHARSASPRVFTIYS